jgi:flagellar biosynthesis protein
MEHLKPHLLNLRQKAVAIQYNPEDAAPKIMAKGAGLIAERILENARIADVPLHKDAALAEELTRMDLGASIPPELYEAVAQVLIFINELDRAETVRLYEKPAE